jgi:hypothetical protein
MEILRTPYRINRSSAPFRILSFMSVSSIMAAKLWKLL